MSAPVGRPDVVWQGTLFKAWVLETEASRGRRGADVFGGHDDVVEPNLDSRALPGCFGDVAQQPEKIQLQILMRSPAKTVKGLTFRRKLERDSFACLVVPAYAVTAFAR